MNSQNKKCGGCSQVLPIENFYRNKRQADGHANRCKICANESQRKHKEEFPERYAEKSRRSALKRDFGITLEQYNRLLENQNNCCAVCEKHQSQEKRNFAVDHDHKTGRIRGLLCTNCNYRLVAKHTDGSLLRKIADYVEQGTDWFVPEKRRTTKRKRKKKT